MRIWPTTSDERITASEHQYDRRMAAMFPLHDKRGNERSSLGRYPNFHWSNELARSRFADMDTVGCNLFARFEMEHHPRLGMHSNFTF